MKDLQKYVVAPPEPARWHGGLRQERPSMLVLHTTISTSLEGTIRYLNHDAPRERPSKRASYNYLIDLRPRIVRWLDPLAIAYHAGSSAWPDPPKKGQSVNRRAIGIAWVNPDRPGTELNDWQMEAGLWLCVTLARRFNIKRWNIAGHKEVSPGRKMDPAIVHMPSFRSAVEAELGAAS
jgi:N-acetylmuramoyl-L-alanine amidase